MKRCSCLNQERFFKTKQLQIRDWILMRERDNSRCTFSLEEELLWIIDSYFLMDLFQLLSTPDDNCWTVDYCDVFIRLSFWRHPFTAEHPLLRHFYKPDEETNSSWSRMIWRWTHFHLGVNYSFILPCLSSYFIDAMNVEYMIHSCIALNLLKLSLISSNTSLQQWICTLPKNKLKKK